MKLGRYSKFIVAVIVPIIIGLQAALENGGIHKADVVKIVIAALGALGVFAFPNTPPVTDPIAANPPPAGGVPPLAV